MKLTRKILGELKQALRDLDMDTDEEFRLVVRRQEHSWQFEVYEPTKVARGIFTQHTDK